VETAHVVVNSHGPPEGRFTFTSHEAGDHTICVATNASKSSTWFSSGSHVRLYLDVVVGSTKPDVEHDRSHVSMLAGKVRELNAKLEEIRREQQYQRERESDFRDLSEATNSKAVWYSIMQIGTLLATCIWQLRHLKVSLLLPDSSIDTRLNHHPAFLRGAEGLMWYILCCTSITRPIRTQGHSNDITGSPR
jgi:hypothetical protein